MKETLSLVGRILGWVALFAAFGALGFTTDNPKVGVPAYLIFFLVVFGGVYLYLRNKKDDTEKIDTGTKKIVNKILGVILTLFAIVVPDLILSSYKFPISIYLMISAISVVLVVIGAFTVKLMNANFDKNVLLVILGYIIFLVLSAIPALIMLRYDSSYNALGLAYWSAISLTIFSWWGISLFTKSKEDE